SWAWPRGPSTHASCAPCAACVNCWERTLRRDTRERTRGLEEFSAAGGGVAGPPGRGLDRTAAGRRTRRRRRTGARASRPCRGAAAVAAGPARPGRIGTLQGPGGGRTRRGRRVPAAGDAGRLPPVAGDRQGRHGRRLRGRATLPGTARGPEGAAL